MFLPSVADFKAVLNWRHVELARIKENSSQGERDEQRDSDEDDNVRVPRSEGYKLQPCIRMVNF